MGLLLKVENVGDNFFKFHSTSNLSFFHPFLTLTSHLGQKCWVRGGVGGQVGVTY